MNVIIFFCMIKVPVASLKHRLWLFSRKAFILHFILASKNFLAQLIFSPLISKTKTITNKKHITTKITTVWSDQESAPYKCWPAVLKQLKRRDLLACISDIPSSPILLSVCDSKGCLKCRLRDLHQK